MKTVSALKYIEGVNSIYEEMPTYEEGHDGSDGKCDCIGMCRGGLIRAGATDVKNMRGTNQAARKAIDNLRRFTKVSALQVGSVVLKVRDKNDTNMPLPDRYRKGGADYDPEIGEVNFTHIGTVTGLDPLTITHMTTPKPMKDTSIKGWTYAGELMAVDYSDQPDPGPDPDPGPEPEPSYARVWSENGKPVKMRAKPSANCNLYDYVPYGSIVEVLAKDCSTDKQGNKWSQISYGSRDGWYMMSEFLLFNDGSYCVIVPGLTKEQAEQLVLQYPGAYIEAGVG